MSNILPNSSHARKKPPKSISGVLTDTAQPVLSPCKE